jgi:pilus assembly protein CpaF
MTMYTESLRAFLKPVLPFLDDDTVSEVMINGPTDVWVERQGLLYKTPATFTEEGLLGAARNMAQFVGRALSDEQPRLDARLPDGSRIHVVLAPIARRGTTISIRKFFKEKLGVDALIRFGSMTEPMAKILEAAILVKLNTVVAGGTGSGKTTLLNILSSLIPNEERILTIESSTELQLNQEHLVRFEARPADHTGKGAVGLGDLLHSALRLRPDRIVVGEVRGGECFYLMQAMNTGHGGSLSTTHANTATDTLRRLEALCLMSGVELPMVAVRAQVASAINLVIVCERFQDGTRKVTAIAEVLPLSPKGDYRTQNIFVFTPVGKSSDGKVLGYFAPTGIVPGFAAMARAYGLTMMDESFFDPATYGVPAPPVHNLGDAYRTDWAPSLKHREKGEADPPAYAAQLEALERKLRTESEKRGGAPAPSPAPAPPAAKPSPAPAAAAARTQVASRPPPPADPDKTPPPTRTPFVQKS